MIKVKCRRRDYHGLMQLDIAPNRLYLGKTAGFQEDVMTELSQARAATIEQSEARASARFAVANKRAQELSVWRAKGGI